MTKRPLPPMALLISLIAQAPGLALAWPLNPSFYKLAAGGVMLVVGLILNLWSERLFRSSGVGVCPFTPVGALVNRGPYAISRNPMYLGIVLANAGISLATGAMANLWTTLVLSLYLHFRFVLPEEKFLLNRLGEPYLRYAASTSRWLGLPG